MLQFSIISLLAVGFLNILLGIFVLLRNTREKVYLYFSGIAFFVGLWAICLAGFVNTDNPDAAFMWAKVYYAAAMFIGLFVLYFAVAFQGYSKQFRIFNIVAGVSVFSYLSILFLKPYFLTGELTNTELNKEIILNKLDYTIYNIIFLSVFFLALYILYSKSKKAKTAQLRAQARTIYLIILAAGILGMIFNLVLPWFDNYQYVWVGPQFTIIFVAGIAYSIVKHKLFDIRLIVARSLAYLLSLGLITGLISLIIYFLSESVRGTHINESVQSLIYVTVTILLVLTYPALKKFFDKVTNSLFYRDAYDAEQFIGQLNQVVVSDIEIYSLLRKVVSVIEDNLKVTNCSFATVHHNGEVVVVNSDPEESQNMNSLNIKLLKDINERRQIVITDYLDKQKDSRLKTHLTEMDIGSVVSLVSKKSNEPEQFSKVYMILGLKKSGNPYTSQDVRVLGIISNSLALAIQNALRFEEISRFNITLQEKIDEATRELKRTNDKLRALDEAKDEFISMASHQLRTPLTSVKGYVSMVLEGDTGPVKASQRKLLQQAFDSSQRMVYLIADLLNVSRLRTGKFVIENRETNLADVVSGEVEQLKEAAENKQIKLSYEKPAKFPIMLLDETKIRQVVMNFLDNAIYYTPSGGEVTISLQKTGDSVEYKVVDTGVGVPKSEQHHLFTKFYRAGNARKMRPDGTGLGLYMAQKVVVAQGGAVIFESEEGKGSTFGFRFPLKPTSSKKAITD